MTTPTKQDALKALEFITNFYIEHPHIDENIDFAKAVNTVKNYINGVDDAPKRYIVKDLSDEDKDLILNSEKSGIIEVYKQDQWQPIETAPKAQIPTLPEPKESEE